MTSSVKFVPKGWGYEKWLVNKEQYCGKLLFLVKGKKCSWHYHKVKDETFYIHKGMVELFYSFNDHLEIANKVFLSEGDTFHVPVGMRHQMLAHKDTELFEFSTQHFDEDSIRIIPGD